MARVALNNLFLDLQKRSKLYSGSAFHRNESWLKRGKETETLVPKESPVTYPKTMLSLCRNLSLVDFYFWRSVAFTFYLFPCARLCNPVLEVAMLCAVVWPCDLLGSFPNQIIPWFCETVWKHGWQFWAWHVAPCSPRLTAPCSQKPGWLGWQRAGERLQNELLVLWGVWLVVSTARTLKPLTVPELWELKANCETIWRYRHRCISKEEHFS